MIKRQCGNTKDRQTLEYSTVYKIAYKFLIEKIPPRQVAKDLHLEVRLVRAITEAKSHKEHWINSVAELAKAGLLNG